MNYIIDKVKSYKNIWLNSGKVTINKELLKVCAWNSANLPIIREQQQQNKKEKDQNTIQQHNQHKRKENTF
jgi:F0F1-type ATP synthase epsilon subunit